MSFFEELKRRNVVRIGAAYAVVAWLLIQVADILLPRFGAPEWAVNSFILIILLCFPVAVIRAWAFELTPDDADLALYATEKSPNINASLSLLNSEFGNGIRSLPKFKELVEQTELPEYWRASGNWPDFCRPLEGNDDFECF